MERVFFMKKLLVVDLQWQFQDEGACTLFPTVGYGCEL